MFISIPLCQTVLLFEAVLCRQFFLAGQLCVTQLSSSIPGSSSGLDSLKSHAIKLCKDVVLSQIKVGQCQAVPEDSSCPTKVNFKRTGQPLMVDTARPQPQVTEDLAFWL